MALPNMGPFQANTGSSQADGGLSLANTDPSHANAKPSQADGAPLGPKDDSVKLTENHQARAAHTNKRLPVRNALRHYKLI